MVMQRNYETKMVVNLPNVCKQTTLGIRTFSTQKYLCGKAFENIPNLHQLHTYLFLENVHILYEFQ